MDGTIGTVRSPLLIGRDDLLELVDRRLDDVVAGHGHVLLVAGEAGIGKTRFLEAISRKADERGFRQSWGFVAPQDQDVLGASVLDLARSMLRDPAFADLGRGLLAVRTEAVGDALAHRRSLVVSMTDRIIDAVTRPTVLGFEDLQWADDVSLEIVAELARRGRDLPLLICGGYRTDEAPIGTSLRDWRARLLTQRIAEEIRLRPLDREQTALVTTLILDTGLPAPREVVDAVYDRTDGVPLHIEELLGALSADARASGLAIREATVPDTIEDAVLARLSHRSPEAQAVARAGAIIGRCFVPEVLAGIMDVPTESIEAPLQELVDHFVLEAPGKRDLYDFRHQLLRDAIYRSVPVGDRRRFHARAGEFGTQLEGQSEIHSSLHFERAGLGRRAFETALAGAREASRLSAHREAFDLYRRAVDHLPDDLGIVERAAIIEAFGDEAAAIEENDVAEEAGRRAADLYREAGETAQAVMAMVLPMSTWSRDRRPVSERLQALKALLAELDALPDDEDTRIARWNIASYLGIALTDGRSLAAAREAFELTRRVGRDVDPEAVGVADWKEGLIDVAAGDVAGGIARIARVAVEAEAAGQQSTGVSAYRDAAWAAASAMEYDEAMRWASAGLRYADSIEQSHCAHVMGATSAQIAWARGDWAQAFPRASQAIVDHGCRRAGELARWVRGVASMGHGRLDDATTDLETALEFADRSEVIDMILPPLWGLAEVALQGGDAERAFALCRDGLARATAADEMLQFVPFVVTGVRAAQASGRPDEAKAWLDASAVRLERVPGVAAPALAHGRGLVALAEGATGIARSALTEAVEGWTARDRIWEGSWARLDLAACLIRSNRFADAVPLAVEVRTTASRIDSPPLAARADALLRQARGHVSVDEPWRPLTSREFAVARLIAEGHTNAEIADELGIAPKTASSHVEHILAKLGASRRAEIASWASSVERAPAPH